MCAQSNAWAQLQAPKAPETSLSLCGQMIRSSQGRLQSSRGHGDDSAVFRKSQPLSLRDSQAGMVYEGALAVTSKLGERST